MAKRSSNNQLEKWEISLVKALIATKEYNDQEILSYFTRPKRTINHARISEIRREQRHKTVREATAAELQVFLKSWPQIDFQTGLSLHQDELFIKAREAMLLAVQSYNNPRAFFKSEIFIVTAIIAWTYLLHYFFKTKKIDYRYAKIVDGKTEYVKTKFGAYKYWELSKCIAHKESPLDIGMKTNLEFLIAIRHEIEHQMTRRLDETISAKIQACCLNFNSLIKKLFGDHFGLDQELSIALQFSTIGVEQRNLLLKEIDLPAHISAMQENFESSLSDKEIKDPSYSYRVAFVQRLVNSKGKADQVVEFLKPDSAEGQEITRILMKETEKKKFKPGAIVKIIRSEGFLKFGLQHHTELWQSMKARDEQKGFGVWLRDRDWWWYEKWVDVVRQHCNLNRDLYIRS